MDDAAQLLLACVVFLATHFIPSTPLRGVLVRGIGQWGYTGLYSAVAFAVIGWMSWAYARTPVDSLWVGIRWLPAALMPLSFILLACGLFASNPTVVGMYRQLRNDDPARGMIRVTRHPVMWALLLWSLSHVAARGDVKSLLFFGTFVIVAGVGTLLIDMRKAGTLGENWTRFAGVTSNIPFVAILQGRNRFDAKEIGWRNPAVGLALYAIVFWLHPMAFGARAY